MEAIKFCLAQRQLPIDAVNLIAYGEQGGEGLGMLANLSSAKVARVLVSELGARPSIEDRVSLVEHHLAHASSAFGMSDFQDALIMTADGFGDGISGCVIDARGADMTTRCAGIDYQNSLGVWYQTVLPFLGYGGCRRIQGDGASSLWRIRNAFARCSTNTST